MDFLAEFVPLYETANTKMREIYEYHEKHEEILKRYSFDFIGARGYSLEHIGFNARNVFAVFEVHSWEHSYNIHINLPNGFDSLMATMVNTVLEYKALYCAQREAEELEKKSERRKLFEQLKQEFE